MILDDEMIKKVLSTNIKSARLEADLTQDMLAEKSNISLTFLKDIERCRSSVSLLTFICLCKALNKTPNDVLRDFFVDCNLNDENLYNQIKILPDYEKNAVFSLLKYFNDNKENL